VIVVTPLPPFIAKSPSGAAVGTAFDDHIRAARLNAVHWRSRQHQLNQNQRAHDLAGRR
jgi:hypothetical protein